MHRVTIGTAAHGTAVFTNYPVVRDRRNFRNLWDSSAMNDGESENEIEEQEQEQDRGREEDKRESSRTPFTMLRQKLREATGVTAQWLKIKGEETKRGAEAWMEQRASELRSWEQDRSALLLGDSLEHLKSSENPLIKLEQQQGPRHVRTGVIYAAAAAGIFSNSQEITRFSRDLMDRDNAALQTWFRKVFSPEEAREISRWMDSVPGAEYAGGWGHRLTHGHDLEAAFALGLEYGHVGLIEWANHVWLRDFWTPHGVPYLPAGSGSVYEWLIGAGISPSTALGLLSINAAEAATGIIGIRAGVRARKAIASYVRSREYAKCLERVHVLVNEGSEAEGLRLVHKTELAASFDEAPHLRLDLAFFCLSRSRLSDESLSSAWGYQAYKTASDLCRDSSLLPRTAPYHGNTEVSFQGLAASIMAAATASTVQVVRPDVNAISQQIEFGVRRFLEVARAQSRIRLQVGQKSVYGHRPYSALTNQFLALEVIYALGSLVKTELDPAGIRRELDDLINGVQEIGDAHSEFAVRLGESLQRVYPLRELAASS
jgi:hypothetical protein